MRVIALKALRDFWENGHADAQRPLEAWHKEAKDADWKGPQDIKQTYRNASFLADNRVVFNIGGNKYRLVVHINYAARIVFIKFVGTHAQYDQVDAATVGKNKPDTH